MAQTRADYQIGLAINEITDLTTGHEVRFAGGGKGQRAFVDLDGRNTAVMGVGTSRLAAVRDLLANVKAALTEEYHAAEADAKADVARVKALSPAKADRPSVEDALAALMLIFGEDIDVEEEDDDRTPGPVWKGTTLVRVVPCVGECMMAHPSSPCDCRCGGSNHAIGGAFMFPILQAAVATQDPRQFKAALAKARPVRLEPKPCLCGCGGQTMRRFVPGHDARYHAAIKRAAKEQEATASKQV